MLKSEIIYREMLEHSSERQTQLKLSKVLGFSLSTVNNAFKPLVSMGAVKILPRGFKIADKEKLFLYWANVRNLEKDIVYSTRVDALPSAIEKSMSPDIVYTAYSAFKFTFKSVPADYSEIYVYSENVEAIKKRFPFKQGPPNLFVLRQDPRLSALAKNNIAPLSQVFVDLWNLKEWYAKEFVNELKVKLYG